MDGRGFSVIVMASNSAEQEGGLSERLSEFSPERLVEEVISAWDEINESSRVNAVLRQRVSSLEAELVNGEVALDRGASAHMEEMVRVAEGKVLQLQRSLENEKARRKEAEESGGGSRIDGLLEENARLLRAEEENLMLILDMEAQITRLVAMLDGN
ncbi:MAG: hypothetical protein CMB58_006590 [Methanobacteriota archaeon]|nr:MAG: hypothetical protein CMB58_006590 [Euryarchaeota archaeon]